METFPRAPSENVNFQPAVHAALEVAKLDAKELERLVSAALDEDLRYGPDVTTRAVVGPDVRAHADVVARAPGVVAGVPVALAVLDAVGLSLDDVLVTVPDGGVVVPGTVILSFGGPARQLLLAERTLLNFLGHLSGIATATNRWVVELAGTSCVVRDTRKTTPGLRQLEKYAVRCGGGHNHRMGLGDAALIKDNHVLAAGGVTQAIDALLATGFSLEIEVECDTLPQVREALVAGVRHLLLDNMNLNQLEAAVALARQWPEVRLEASGGITIATARGVALTGVDAMAVGALTHSSPSLDIALDLRGSDASAPPRG